MVLNFILVEPAVPENIGASARAMKTMGHSSLSLVKPCEYLKGKAIWVAHGSSDILEKAQQFETLNDAIIGAGLVIGTTARHRAIKQESIPANELASYISTHRGAGSRVDIVFGCEESGLSNEELLLCDIASSIPMIDKYPSLNLAQAVMIFAWELSMVGYTAKKKPGINASDASVRDFKRKMTSFVKQTEMQLNDPLFGRILERVSLAGQKDINLMYSFLAALEEANKKPMN